jgi:hypothetical protein
MKYSEMKKLAEKAKATVDLTPAFLEFKKAGDSVIGRLKNVSQVQSGLTEGHYNQYLFETDDGLVKCAVGAATDKEAGSMMVIGRVYSVEYRGKEKISGGRSVNKFKITEIDESMLPKGQGKDDVPF